jgi:thioesterase domain-containing protein/acyl carrier protein
VDAIRPLMPIGRAIANTQLYILDGTLEPVAAGVAGELCIAGSGVARGYLGRPDLTAASFVPDPFGPAGSRMYRTGDLARWLADGSIEFLGRSDQQVKLRGFRIELGEIEAVLSGLAGVGEAAVVARDGGPGERSLVAYVVPLSSGLDAATLRLALSGVLPDYMLPQHVVVLDRLPLTANGKLDRRALPAPDAAADGPDYVAPRTATEATLAGLWAEVLGLEGVGVHDDFFARGGHSLLAVRVITKIKQLLGVELPLAELFTAPSIAALATVIEQRNPNRGLLIPLKKGGKGPPLILFHPAGGDILGYVALVNALDDAIPVVGVRSAVRAGIADDPEDFDQLCERYATVVLQDFGGGPCYLAGWSLGGKIAFQVAWLLEQRGVEVCGLVMLDATVKRRSARPETPADLADFLTVMSTLSSDEVAHLFGADAVPLHGRLKELADGMGMAAFAGMLQAADPVLEAKWKFGVTDQEAFLRIHEMMVITDRAVQRFAPKPLKAPIHSFWAEETIAEGYEAASWLPYSENTGCAAGPILPGRHTSFIMGENARQIGRALNELLCSMMPGETACDDDHQI